MWLCTSRAASRWVFGIGKGKATWKWREDNWEQLWIPKSLGLKTTPLYILPHMASQTSAVAAFLTISQLWSLRSILESKKSSDTIFEKKIIKDLWTQSMLKQTSQETSLLSVMPPSQSYEASPPAAARCPVSALPCSSQVSGEVLDNNRATPPGMARSTWNPKSPKGHSKHGRFMNT